MPVRKSQKLWRSRKITDKIAVLQKLVSPRAKADAAASVLHEAYNSIKALQDQIQNLCNMESTSHNSDSLFHAQNSRGEQIDLQSKGICVVPLPVSLMQKLTDEDVFSENMQS